MCFIEERYARGLENSGMLGYVFDDDIESARSSVAALSGQITDNYSARERLDSGLRLF
jgi:hypothetical protein